MSDVEFDAVGFGRRLKGHMVLAGLSTQELSDRMGLAVITVRRHMNGRNLPDVSQLLRYSGALGCSPLDLLPRQRWDVAAMGWAPSDSNRQPTEGVFPDLLVAS